MSSVYAPRREQATRSSPGGDESPHCCNGGWVSMMVEATGETGEEVLEEVLYLCRRCNEVEGAGGYLL